MTPTIHQPMSGKTVLITLMSTSIRGSCCRTSWASRRSSDCADRSATKTSTDPP